MAREHQFLTLEQRAHFLEQGWVKIQKAVLEEIIARLTDNVWMRLGYDPEDKSTWKKEKVSPLILVDLICSIPCCRGQDSHAQTPRDSYQRLHAQGMGCNVYGYKHCPNLCF